LKVWIVEVCNLLVITEVSERPAASTFKVEIKTGPAFCPEAPVTTDITKWCHNPKDHKILTPLFLKVLYRHNF
jgi:hypothetical protein